MINFKNHGTLISSLHKLLIKSWKYQYWYWYQQNCIYIYLPSERYRNEVRTVIYEARFVNNHLGFIFHFFYLNKDKLFVRSEHNLLG